MSDASDASDAIIMMDVQPYDAVTDAPPLGDFITAISTAYCARLEACCGLTSQTFNTQDCVAIYAQSGSPWLVGGYPPPGYVASYDAGPDGSSAVPYNQAQAIACINATQDIPCGTISSAMYNQVRETCFSATQGTSLSGTPCVTSIECGQGLRCAPGDAGNTCQLLVGDGGACTSDDDCTYLYSGVPASYCTIDDGVAADAATCAPEKATGASCSTDLSCTSLSCNGHCIPSFLVSDPGVAGGTCAYFTVISDAGGD